MIRAVTFDAAGTLILPEPSVGAVYAEVARAHGFDRDPDELERAFRPAFAAVVARWAVPYGGDDEDARRFWGEVIDATFGEPLPYEVCCELYDTFATPGRWRVLPGVDAALMVVASRGLPMAVVSNFDCRLPPLLRALNLGPFAAVVTSAMVGAAKPDPAALLTACRALGVPPTEVLHVGDSAREDGALCERSGARYLAVDPARGLDLAALTAALA